MPTGADLKSEIAVLEDDLAEFRQLQEKATRPGVHRVLRGAIETAAQRIAAIRKQLRDAGVATEPPTAPVREEEPRGGAEPIGRDEAPESDPCPPPLGSCPPEEPEEEEQLPQPEPPHTDPGEAREPTPNDRAAEQKKADDAAGILWKPTSDYAWDQSDKFVKIYVDLPGVGSAERVYCHFQPQAFDFRAVGVAGKHYRCAVHQLCESINIRESTVLVKPNKFVIKLVKLRKCTEWSGVDDVEKRKKLQHKKLADSGATTEELLANMFKDADDKTRAELSQAAFEGRKKRESEAASKGW
eukprot:TRINITY_DN16678_c0_g1_i1.p1 TRINITY_DN16678_c0_g1~~TRINITY_DN16678_c0_g1_i1.p1  ORF type:complete len:299 (+),score=108.77 TRINITY_DN16678_c0_g1_i1:224-1120(+)